MKLTEYPNYNYEHRQLPSLTPNQYQQEQMDRKFGMFIHFGINTFNNTEWSDGTLPIESYNPISINADSWIKTAYKAGMNYVILITKHHDGFCMWNTHTTEYSVNYSPVKTDVVEEVAKACKKYGIKLGLYYSLWDRHEKCYNNNEEYVKYMGKQLEELLDGRYGEIVELWFDGAWDKACCDWQLDYLYDLIKRLQSKCQVGVNHTIGKYSDEKGWPDERYLPKNYQQNDPIRMFPSDFRLWDPYMCREDDPKVYTFNGEKYYLPFEQTICSRKEFSWFYSDIYEQKPLMDTDEIITNFRILDKANNMMVINMPPNYEGELVKSDVENLMRVSQTLGICRKL